jgi:hypothetical protein
LEAPGADPMFEAREGHRLGLRLGDVSNGDVSSGNTSFVTLPGRHDIGVPVLLVGGGAGEEVMEGVGEVVVVSSGEVFNTTVEFKHDVLVE